MRNQFQIKRGKLRKLLNHFSLLMRTIKGLTRGRKPATPLISESLATRWENLREKHGITVFELPVSAPTYRKAIVTGLVDGNTLRKLTQFFEGL